MLSDQRSFIHSFIHSIETLRRRIIDLLGLFFSLDFMGVLRTTIGEQKTLWDVEDNFDKDPWVTWLRARWMDSFVYAAIYVVVIFGGQYVRIFA